MLGDNEMDPKSLESVDGHGYYENKDGEAEHDGMSMDYYCKYKLFGKSRGVGPQFFRGDLQGPSKKFYPLPHL